MVVKEYLTDHESNLEGKNFFRDGKMSDNGYYTSLKGLPVDNTLFHLSLGI